VKDDGVGGAAANARGHGLIGMRERVRLLGGRLQVRSRPGEGTTITAQVPEAE
jgi:signal transduction histidine kinase